MLKEFKIVPIRRVAKNSISLLKEPFFATPISIRDACKFMQKGRLNSVRPVHRYNYTAGKRVKITVSEQPKGSKD